MILVKNKWFPFGNYKAINICGIVFYKGDNLSDKTINHEKIHTKQMIELLFIFFYLWYGIEYLIIRLFHKKQNDVYHDVSFEEEAHNNDDNLNYIDTRKHYAWFKYIKVKSSNNKGNKITSPMFTPIDVRKLYDKKFKSINSNITFWDVYVALNAQYHDNIELYKEWFGEDNIENIKDKIIESAIVNWFEDEDAGIEKV